MKPSSLIQQVQKFNPQAHTSIWDLTADYDMHIDTISGYKMLLIS